MSEKSSLAYAYLMGYDDALAKRKPDASKTEVLASGDLAAENAKLREESSKYNDLYVHAIADAEAWHLQWSAEHQENAKLRELVLDMYEMAYPEYPSAFAAAFANRMRELGVEVPD